MRLMGLWPGKTMKLRNNRFSARQTLRTERQTVALPMCSASPTLYKKLPVAKKLRAMQIVCSELRADPQLVTFAM